MKKKVILALVGVMICGVVMAGCGSKQEKVNTLDKVKESKVFKIGLSPDYPPFEYTNDKNEIVGFDIDLSNAIAEKLGAKTEIVTVPFDGIVQGLKSNKFDMVASGFTVTEKRQNEVLFTDNYLNSGQYIVLNTENNDIKTVEDLKGKTIGVGIGTTSADAAKKIEGVKEVKEYNKTPEGLLDLKNKRIDAVVVDKPVCDYYLDKDKGSYKKIDANIEEEPIALAFKKEDTQIQQEVNKILKELKEDGTLSKLSEKWFGFDAYK